MSNFRKIKLFYLIREKQMKMTNFWFIMCKVSLLLVNLTFFKISIFSSLEFVYPQSVICRKELFWDRDKEMEESCQFLTDFAKSRHFSKVAPINFDHLLILLWNKNGLRWFYKSRLFLSVIWNKQANLIINSQKEQSQPIF